MDKQVLSVAEFCDAYGIQRTFLYKLLKAGKGPRIMKVGRRTYISREAADEWRRSLELEPVEAARLLGAQAEAS